MSEKRELTQSNRAGTYPSERATGGTGSRVCGGLRISGERFFDLSGKFGRERIEALPKISNKLQEIVVGDKCGYRGEKTCRGRDERFGNAGRDCAEAGGARRAKTREGVDDAPYRAEEADERGYAGGGCQPRHALFDTPDFFRGRQLHVDDNSLETF